MILGPNGAGKSTLLRTAALVTPPRRGAAVVNGEPITSVAAARRASRTIAYLPQETPLLAAFTVAESVRYAAWLRDAACDPATVNRALAAVGLQDDAHRKVRQLSGGSRRRLGIAQALVAEPAIALLDEPTVGLDPLQRVMFRDALRALGGSCIVISTHLLDDAAVLAERIVVLAGGEIRFDGPPSGLHGPEGPGSIEAGYVSLMRTER